MYRTGNDLFLFGVCGKLDVCLVEQRNSRYDMWTRPRLQAETHAGVFMLGRVFVCQPSNQSDPLQTDISPANPPSQLRKHCTVTVRTALPTASHTDQFLLMLMVEMTTCILPGYTHTYTHILPFSLWNFQTWIFTVMFPPRAVEKRRKKGCGSLNTCSAFF